MAAYAATVTLMIPRPEPVGRLKLVYGRIDLTNYNQTLAEVTAISRLFRGPFTVLFGGSTANGYNLIWDTSAKSAKSYNTGGTQTSTDVAVGACDFIAVGVA